ncbi:hypothetical protein JMJ77_0010778 [Colletotrichum scovillei]|uniref:Uncharacterized protein n=1 Tax=Colletotrichum scovillei TaxID=1209932 RepID=A0A9P7UAN6_9PEZI|nr:hypothetical protein JMJ77_0010778 [Colletotrichum scovillei]KAG7059745.1 hypothetical protein JMJ78_0015034 [Colletotrichum scovillei]KAG7067191.1 hypothetical protein JMJ76_0008634 [Colletotrichum scovillei]
MLYRTHSFVQHRPRRIYTSCHLSSRFSRNPSNVRSVWGPAASWHSVEEAHS